ncbi:MAG: decaprenyl-phosphate phosphoribosyltransferase [Proteobacteria bacterium]|nr:decaprenyl-phosphate phosphoribosyltransferase [Pseudomonadota bacterium]
MKLPFNIRLPELLRLARPKQWVKNGFVLAPLVFARAFHDTVALQNAGLAFVLFCVASSATYILNDLRDIERDRAHPVKSWSRPLAAGTVKPRTAIALLVVLYAVLVAGLLWSPLTMAVIAAYMALNFAYSFWLKHQPVLDIFSVASGFVLRIFAGAVAIAVPVSNWMAITTLCLALYLASIKRRQELATSGSGGREVLQRYSVALVDRYAEISAVGALIFYSLFVMSSGSDRMALTIPLVIFGLFRYWYVVEALDGGESPTDVAVTDKPLIATVGLWVAACLYALS